MLPASRWMRQVREHLMPITRGVGFPGQPRPALRGGSCAPTLLASCALAMACSASCSGWPQCQERWCQPRGEFEPSVTGEEQHFGLLHPRSGTRLGLITRALQWMVEGHLTIMSLLPLPLSVPMRVLTTGTLLPRMGQRDAPAGTDWSHPGRGAGRALSPGQPFPSSGKRVGAVMAV